MGIKWIDDKDIFGRIALFTDDPVFASLKNAIEHKGADFSDAFSWGQLRSKRWLVSEAEKLNKKLGMVFLCGGWYATLAPMLFNSSCDIEKIRSFDIDPTCQPTADAVNKQWVLDEWKFKAVTMDILDMKYPTTYTPIKANGQSNFIATTEMPDTIINTSCEHITEFAEWYSGLPAGKILMLQSNNFGDGDGHTNCVNSIDEFEKQTPMTNVWFSGELVLPKYTRYMRIGQL